MENKLEVFYGDDLNEKIIFMEQVFQELFYTFKNNQAPVIDLVLFKALNRVLNDDYKKSPDVILSSLKNIHLIMKNISLQKKLELITENSVDNFQWTALKIFVWEFKRLKRIFLKFKENNQNSSQIQTMNKNIYKQTKIFIFLLLIFKENFTLVQFIEDNTQESKIDQYKQNFINFNLIEYFVKLYDYEDIILLKTITNFLIEIMDEQIGQILLEKGILYRISRFLHQQELQQIWILVGKLCLLPSIRKNLINYKFFIKQVLQGLEKKQISNALFILNLFSLDKNLVDILMEFEIEIYLMNLVTIFFKKDDEVIKQKRILWNLLLNLTTHSNFSLAFLKFNGFESIINYMFRSQDEAAFKILDNCFSFCKNNQIKKDYGKYSGQLLECFQNLRPQQNIQQQCIINILAEIYINKERKPISFMMKQMKDSNIHQNFCIASFNFLNKALISKILDKNLINKSVTDYVLKKFFQEEQYMDDEVKFQFLFFLYNLMIIQNVQIDFQRFCKFINEFQQKNSRYYTIILNILDVFLKQSIQNETDTQYIKIKKFEIFNDFFQNQEHQIKVN